MKNLDNSISMESLRQELFNALQTDDSEQQEKAFMNFAEGLQDSVINQAKAQAIAETTTMNDGAVLVNRGTMMQLTSEERQYFNKVIERAGFDNVEDTFPKTIVQDVFKDLRQNHPILSRIHMADTTALVQYIFANPNKATAFWGPICEDIKQMILEGFQTVDIKSSRLSGFVVVCKGMLELGPEWLARYVTDLMYEIMAAALETAVVSGDGDEKPIGMMRELSGAVDSVYPEKDAVVMNDFEPTTMAAFRGALAKAKLDSAGVVLMVNPVTYWAKLFPNLAYRADSGAWVLDRLATGEEILQSYAVPEDRIIVGDPNNYFLGVSGDVRIDRYKETLAIEDMELFITKFYGYGLPKDANAFFVGDISTVKGATIPSLEELNLAGEEVPGA